MNSKLKPNVKIRDDGGHLTKEVVRGIVTNPVYAGVGEYEGIVSDKLWLETNKVAIEEAGAEQYLVNLIYCVEQSFGCEIKNKEEWTELAKAAIEKKGEEKFLKVFLIDIRHVFRKSYIKRVISLPIGDVIARFIKCFDKLLNRSVKTAIFVLNIRHHRYALLYMLHFSSPFLNNGGDGAKHV